MSHGQPPYCGVPPAPDELMARWNVDPVLSTTLAAAGLGWWVWRARGGRARDGVAVMSLAVLLVAFVSPLCALSSALFSARVVHHGLLVAVAAPLLAFAPARPWRILPLPAATLAHGLLFWIWHAPGPYAWALSADAAYWLMQGCLFLSALAFWAAVRRGPALAAAGGLLLTTMQMGLLGALISLAGAPLYAPHLLTTTAWGLSALEDQQLAGLIMWAPMAGAYLAAALVLVGRQLRPPLPAAAQR